MIEQVGLQLSLPQSRLSQISDAVRVVAMIGQVLIVNRNMTNGIFDK